MKILAFGRGVITTQYGWAFYKAGHSVDFYVRPGRAVAYGPAISLDIFDLRSSFRGSRITADWPVKFLEELDSNHDYDLILVSVPHYRFEEVAAFLGSRAGKASILLFNNFWADPLTAARALPSDQLVWGFPSAGGGFDQNGTLRGSFFKRVRFGTFGSKLTVRELAVRNLFRSTGFQVTEQDNFRDWLWTHFALNAGLHAQALQVGSIAAMMNSVTQGKEAVLNVREILPVLKARGVDLGEQSAEVGLFRLPSWVGALALKAFLKLHVPTRTIVENHANPEELKFFCRDVLASAHQVDVRVPRLEAAQPYFAAAPAPGRANGTGQTARSTDAQTG